MSKYPTSNGVSVRTRCFRSWIGERLLLFRASDISIVANAESLVAIDPRTVLQDLEERGFCLVKSSHEDPLSEDLPGFVSRLGKLHRHREQGSFLWDVRPCLTSSEVARSHTALAFPMHTDCSFEDPPPRYLALQVVRPDAHGGGESLFARVEDVLNRLSDDDLKVLSQDFAFKVPSEFHKGIDCRCLPILTDQSFRYRREILLDCTQTQHGVLDRFEDALGVPGIVSRFRLEKGAVLLLDNHRFLHGRTTILDPKRHLRRVRFQSL